MNNERKYGLSAPIVPVADIDGLIKVDDLEKDVIVNFPVWYAAKEQDTYQLLLNGQLVGNLEKLPNPVPDEGAELTLVIPVATQLKEDGVYAVGYRATTFPGGTPADSTMTTIQVDRTPPGAALLAPIIFPDVTLGEALIGVVAGYAGMQVGNVIQTLCNGVSGPAHTVQTENLTTSPVHIQFDHSFLQSLDSSEVAVSYAVADRAGNVSITSKHVTVTLQA